MKDFLLQRLAEKASWIGIVLIASAIGITLSPWEIEIYIAVSSIVIGAIAFLWPDRPARPKGCQCVPQEDSSSSDDAMHLSGHLRYTTGTRREDMNGRRLTPRDLDLWKRHVGQAQETTGKKKKGKRKK